MTESSGTFWSWISACHVVDCWHPDVFRPEYIALDDLLTSTSGLAPLRDFVDTVPPSDTALQPAKWYADVSGIRRHIVGRTDAERAARASVMLPREAILVSSQWVQEPSIRYWSEDVFRGRGTASSQLWVLKGRTSQSIAWLCDALRRKDSTLQLQRAVAGSTVPHLTLDALLNVRVKCIAEEQRDAASRFVRDSATSEARDLHLKALRKPFVLTGQTFEERITQFEQFLETEGLCSREDAFFVEPSTNSKASDLFTVRPLRSGSAPSRRPDTFVPQNDGTVSLRWRSWFWDESATECHRVFNSLAADDALPTHLLLRTAAASVPSGFGDEKCILPQFEVFRQAALSAIHADDGGELQLWGNTWNDLQRSAGYLHALTDQSPNDATSPRQLDISDHSLFEWARRVYRPVLALKVWRGESIVGAYLLFGDDQFGDFAAAYSTLDDIGIALADVLRPQVDLAQDATRRESLRRLSWVMHQLNGPVGRANSALEDINEFLNGHADVAALLVPNEDNARRRARMPGNNLGQQTLSARLQTAMKAVGDVRKIAYQVRRLRRVQGTLAMSPLCLAELVRERSHSCQQQIPRLSVECAELPNTMVLGNRDSLREAIDEVLSNACRELRERDVDEPKLELRCWIREMMAWLTVRDNALPATERLIADPFEEDSSTYAASGRGTGLGLAIVRETFRAHGGYCSLSENFAEDGRAPGVTFAACVPLRQPQALEGGA